MKIINLLLIILFSLIEGKVIAQLSFGENDSLKISKGPDHLLWYSGKKKNDTTLILSTGGQVSVNKNSGKVTVKFPTATDPFKKIDAELDATDKREEVAKKILLSGNDAIVNYPIYHELEKAYVKEKAIYKEITQKQIETPEEDKKQTAIKNLVGKLSQKCPEWEKEFKEIEEWVKQHKNDFEFNLPVPPYMDYDHCLDCDPKKQELYDTAVVHYIKEVEKEEGDRIKKLFEMERAMLLLGFDEKGSYNYPVTDDESRTITNLFDSRNKTPCSWMPSAINKSADLVYYLVSRLNNKANFLLKKYRKDFHYTGAITRVTLDIGRNTALITGSEASGDHFIAELSGVFSNFLSEFKDKLRKPDYYAFANTRFYFQLLRNYMLLGANTSEDEVAIKWFLKYNRFKLHFDIDCKQGAEGAYILAHLNGDNFVRFIPDSEHCVKLFLISSGDVSDYFRKKDTNLKLKLIDASMVAPSPRLVYAGTHDWQTIMPDIRFHMCDDGKDTIIVHAILPEGFKENWNMPGMGIVNAGYVSSLLMGCFLDMKNVQEAGAIVESHEAEIEKKIKEQGAKMEAMAAKYKSNLAKGIKPSMEEMAKWNKMGEEMQQTSLLTTTAPHVMGNYFFEVNKKNEKQMINERIDGKKLFPENEGLIYAYFQIQLTQDPK